MPPIVAIQAAAGHSTPSRSRDVKSDGVTYRVTTSDGMVVIVDEVDLQLVRAYLVLRGYPPVSVEASGLLLAQLGESTHQA